MEEYSVEHWQEHWEELITRVENGETIGVFNGRSRCVMIPTDDYYKLYTEDNNEAQ